MPFRVTFVFTFSWSTLSNPGPRQDCQINLIQWHSARDATHVDQFTPRCVLDNHWLPDLPGVPSPPKTSRLSLRCVGVEAKQPKTLRLSESNIIHPTRNMSEPTGAWCVFLVMCVFMDLAPAEIVTPDESVDDYLSPPRLFVRQESLQTDLEFLET